MTDERWMLEKIVAHERESGRSEARHDASEAAISRVAGEMKDGFAKIEAAQLSGFNALRGEIKAAADIAERERAEDVSQIMTAVNDMKHDKAEFQKALSRVGWAIIAAVVAAAAAQTALSPQVAGMAVNALGQIQQ